MTATNVLEDNVLVLNKFYLAIAVYSVRDAVISLYKEEAKVIDQNWVTYAFDQWVAHSQQLALLRTPVGYLKIHTPNFWFYAPHVIVLTDCEEKLPDLKQIRFSRKNVMLRDQYLCQYCGHAGTTGELTLDHVLPKSRGGPSSYSNIVTACKTCNMKKGNKTPEEAGMTLLKKPTVPKWKSHVGAPLKKKEYWKQFLA